MTTTKIQREVDARGLSCPEPLWLTKNALDGLSSGTILVLVDDPTAYINVTRYAEQQGCAIEADTDADGYRIRITKG